MGGCDEQSIERIFVGQSLKSSAFSIYRQWRELRAWPIGSLDEAANSLVRRFFDANSAELWQQLGNEIDRFPYSGGDDDLARLNIEPAQAQEVFSKSFLEPRQTARNCSKQIANR